MYWRKKLLQEKGYTTYKIRKEGLIGNATYQALKNPSSGKGLDHRTIDKLCKALECQPGDIMEYIPDSESNIDVSAEIS